jgi:cold shock CspA family protein
MPTGEIRKLMFTAPARPVQQGTSALISNKQGYGLIRSQDGRSVYFIDAVVQNGKFGDLGTGQRVEYDLEDGPLAQASTVRPLSG